MSMLPDAQQTAVAILVSLHILLGNRACLKQYSHLPVGLERQYHKRGILSRKYPLRGKFFKL